MSTNASKPRILVVEDDPTNALIAATICQRAGWEVAVARDGQEALALFEATPFDLLLVDVQMPVMDGLTLARTLRRRADGAGLPLVAITARAGLSDHREIREAGFDAVITKPYHNQDLRAAVNRALGLT
jgi:CheY-like chemotaxis protein